MSTLISKFGIAYTVYGIIFCKMTFIPNESDMEFCIIHEVFKKRLDKA
jgi:hypothetical protein